MPGRTDVRQEYILETGVILAFQLSLTGQAST